MTAFPGELQMNTRNARKESLAKMTRDLVVPLAFRADVKLYLLLHMNPPVGSLLSRPNLLMFTTI